MKFFLYPIYWVAQDPWGERFDLDRLPFHIAEGAYIEDVSHLLRKDTFSLWEKMVGESRMERIGRLRYALIHRYDPAATDGSAWVGNTEGRNKSRSLVGRLAACLRLVRPMRQRDLLFAHGNIRDEDGTLDVNEFELSSLDGGAQVPGIQRLFTMRNQDADELSVLAPVFLRAIRGDFGKFRMAVEFHELGYFQSNWKARFLLWCSAIESIYTSSNRDHQGSKVAQERIKWFIGESTRIYAPEDLNIFDQDPGLTIRDVLNDLYKLRNFVAHGDRVPDSFSTTMLRYTLDGQGSGGSKLEVLFEAASLIIRSSLLKILKEDLVDHFADAHPAQEYFAARGLTNSALRARTRPNQPTLAP